MVGLVAQSRAVLVEAAVLWRHEHAEIVKLLFWFRHVHEAEGVCVSPHPVTMNLLPPVQAAPLLALLTVEDEAVVEADQLPRPHRSPHKQPLTPLLKCARPDEHRALLKRICQVCWDTETVEVWRIVG